MLGFSCCCGCGSRADARGSYRPSATLDGNPRTFAGTFAIGWVDGMCCATGEMFLTRPRLVASRVGDRRGSRANLPPRRQLRLIAPTASSPFQADAAPIGPAANNAAIQIHDSAAKNLVTGPEPGPKSQPARPSGRTSHDGPRGQSAEPARAGTICTSAMRRPPIQGAPQGLWVGRHVCAMQPGSRSFVLVQAKRVGH